MQLCTPVDHCSPENLLLSSLQHQKHALRRRHWEHDMLQNDTAAERCQQLHMQLRPGSTVLVHDWQYQVISSSGPATHRKSKQSGMLCTKRRFPGRNTHHPAQLNSHAGCSCVHMTLLLGPALQAGAGRHMQQLRGGCQASSYCAQPGITQGAAARMHCTVRALAAAA